MQIKKLYNNYKELEQQYKQAKQQYQTVINHYNTVKTYTDILNNDDLSEYEPQQISNIKKQLKLSQSFIEEVTDLESIIL